MRKQDSMAGKKKTPVLRRSAKYFVVSFYKPDGQRSTISFGTCEERSEGEIYEAFGKWLDLYTKSPQKVLSNHPLWDDNYFLG